MLPLAAVVAASGEDGWTGFWSAVSNPEAVAALKLSVVVAIVAALVNAVFGFLQIVLRGMQDVKPDYAIVSFDLGKPQFRFDAYPAYKAGRPSMPDDG